MKIARALLPNCYTDVTEFCNDTIAMPQGETTIIYVGEDPLRGYDKNQFGSLSNFQAVENSYLTPDFGKSISYDLYNLSGMRVMSGNKPMDIYKDDNVGVGIYILVFTDSSGKIKTTKLAKIR